MKPTRPVLFLGRRAAAIVLALGLATLAHAQGAIIHAWDFSRAVSLGSTVEVPETGAGPAIAIREGATLVKDADEGRQVLVFDGKQTDWGRTKRNLEPISAVQIRLRFKPVSGGAPQQTIVAVSGCYELRYNTSRSQLEFIVHLPEKKFVIARTEAAADVWNRAVATYLDGKLSLTVGLSRSEAALPPGIKPDPVGTTVRLGHWPDRPFLGSISELILAEP